jgi:hypothetical protein
LRGERNRGDVADRGLEGRGDDDVDAGDGRQPPDLRRGQGVLGDERIDAGELVVEEGDLPQPAVEGFAFLEGQPIELGQLAAALDAEQVADRRGGRSAGARAARGSRSCNG